MAKTGKEEKVEAPVEQPVVEAPPPQTETFTQEQLEAAKAEARAEELEKYQGIQRTIAKKDQELQQLRQKAQPAASSQTYKTFLDALESGDYGEAKAMIGQMEQKEAEEARYQQWMTASEVERDNLKQIFTEANQDPNDEQFAGIWLDLETALHSHGKFDLVHKKAKQVLKLTPKETPKEKGKVTLDQLSDEDKEELKRQAMESDLTTHIATPSGASGGLTATQIAKMSPEERFARSEEIAKMPMGYKPLA